MSNAFTSDNQLKAPSRRGYHHGNLAEALVEAARFLIAERGPQGFTLIEAARLVNVSPAAPYRHYRDRTALIAAVATRGFSLFGERLEAALRLDAPPLAQLRAMGDAYLAFAREEPGYYGAMFGASRSGPPPLLTDDSGAFGALVECVRRVLAGGPGAPPPEVDPALIALEIWALAHGIASLAGHGQWPAVMGAPAPDVVLRDATAAIIARAARQTPGKGST